MDVKLNAPALNRMSATAVVLCRRDGVSMVFAQLNIYFQMQRMTQVCSQYWNQVYGFTPDEVRRDVEGMQMMFTLARNMAGSSSPSRLSSGMA